MKELMVQEEIDKENFCFSILEHHLFVILIIYLKIEKNKDEQVVLKMAQILNY